MSNITIHKSNTRGHANHGWLNARHSFSFANYYNPERMHFGVVRVLNDDIIAPAMGFGTHPHDNMEIVSIPLTGALEHKDSTGTQSVINENDVQIMSAGSGLSHSEYNHFKDRTTNFLQVWVMPKKRNIEPRYDQKTFNPADRIDHIQTVVAPDDDKAVWINQDSWFSLSNLMEGKTIDYSLKKKGNGVYVFVIEGKVIIEQQELQKRDALGIWEVENVGIKASADSEILIIEVPMKGGTNE